MYIPASFAEPDVARLHDFMRRHSFALLTSVGADGLVASHLPLLLDPGAGSRASSTGTWPGPTRSGGTSEVKSWPSFRVRTSMSRPPGTRSRAPCRRGTTSPSTLEAGSTSWSSATICRTSSAGAWTPMRARGRSPGCLTRRMRPAKDAEFDRRVSSRDHASRRQVEAEPEPFRSTAAASGSRSGGSPTQIRRRSPA